MSVFKLMRIVALLSILFVLVVGTWMTERRLASWERPAWVVVYPIVADDATVTLEYAQSVDEFTFAAVNEFMARESMPYGIKVTPAFYIEVAQVSTELPPEIPDQYSPVAIAWWSLKMRWWAWKMGFNDDLAGTDIQMFILYRGADGRGEVDISVGMRKGRYGVVNAYADKSMNPRNMIIFTHELMHVFGASDKYIRATGEPEYPFGFADPNQHPLFPQKRAEIMGVRIPLSSFVSEMPRSLEQCKIGRRTAEEIGFFARLID
ncbi:MAG: hypothetical protein V3R56_04200 [Xanthomonadales bacterium]